MRSLVGILNNVKALDLYSGSNNYTNHVVMKKLMALILVIFIASCGEDTSGNRQSESLLTPALGNLKGVPVAIPVEYQFFAVNYEGESVWEGKKLKEKATLNTPIESFGIRVLLPDMLPKKLENEADWQSHTFGNGDSFYPWITVSVRSLVYDLPPEQWNNAWVERWMGDNFNSKGCHYESKNDKRFDLTVKKLVCGNQNDKMSGRSKDFMYDEKSKQTIIICDKSKLVSPAGKHTCLHRFPVNEMNIMAEYRFYPEHLKDWKDNQEKLTKLIKSFVVESSKNYKLK